MFLSKLLGINTQEAPGGGSKSFQLLARAGIARKVASGIYALLPLGNRVRRALEDALRRRLEEAGAQEVFLPSLQPAELWERSGKLPLCAEGIFRAKDAEGRRFCVAPGIQEPIAFLAGGCITSYRQLPVTIYRLGERNRDRARPASGLGDARCSVALEVAWFGLGKAQSDEASRAMADLFSGFLRDCGLDCRVAHRPPREGVPEAISFVGPRVPGGPEFFVDCPSCGFLRRGERQRAAPPPSSGTPPSPDELPKPLQKIHTPGVRTIQDLANMVGESPCRMTKILFYQAVTAPGEPKLVAALIRGDQELSESALGEYLGADYLALARPQDVLEKLGVPVGSAGPVGLRGVEILADRAVLAQPNLISGANEEDYHLLNVNHPRDFAVNGGGEFATLVPSDPCPTCGGPLDGWEGSEVARLEGLRSELVRAFRCVITGTDGEQQALAMGYGWLDLWRLTEAVASCHLDEDGVGWPPWLAPYQVIIIPLGKLGGELRQAALAVYDELRRARVEVILDDRDERPGVKFKDADFLGFPYSVVLAPGMVPAGTVELKARRDRRGETLPRDELVGVLLSRLGRQPA